MEHLFDIMVHSLHLVNVSRLREFTRRATWGPEGDDVRLCASVEVHLTKWFAVAMRLQCIQTRCHCQTGKRQTRWQISWRLLIDVTKEEKKEKKVLFFIT